MRLSPTSLDRLNLRPAHRRLLLQLLLSLRLVRVVPRQIRFGCRYIGERRLDLVLTDGARRRDGDARLGLRRLVVLAQDRLLGGVVLLFRGGDDGAGGCCEREVLALGGVGFSHGGVGDRPGFRRDQLRANARMKPSQARTCQLKSSQLHLDNGRIWGEGVMSWVDSHLVRRPS